MSHVLIFLVRVYQLSFGVVLPRVCRFEPTCSHYAIDALRTHGSCRGSLLTLWRILRCNPFTAGGWDPVPHRHSAQNRGTER